jgi:hypothetical protein
MDKKVNTYTTIIAVVCSVMSYIFSSSEVKKTAERLEAKTQYRILELEYKLNNLISDIEVID